MRNRRLSLAGKRAIITANIGSDWVYVGVTGLDIGADRIYLTGNLSDYEQSIRGNIYTLTREVEVNVVTETEEIKFTIQNHVDRLYFADGSLDINEETLYDASLFRCKQITDDLLDKSDPTPASFTK